MKKFGLFLFLALLFSACSKNNPNYVSKDYLKAIQEGDLRRAKSYIYVPASIQRELSPKDISKLSEEKIQALKAELGNSKCDIAELEEIGELVVKVKMHCLSENGIIDRELNVVDDGGVYKIILSL